MTRTCVLWGLLFLTLTACSTNPTFWAHRKSEYGYKSTAFEECGADYRVLEYREEEVLIECLPPR